MASSIAPLGATQPSTAEQQLSQTLACFQAEVCAIPCADLDLVVTAARAAFRNGISWSAHLLEEQGRSRLQVTVMHIAGAELISECSVNQDDQLTDKAGLMLAMLLGIPVSNQACTAKPCSSLEQDSIGEPGDATLSQEQIAEYHRQVLELPQATRKELTTAFREHFQVPRNARSIGDRITLRQHGIFIEKFLEECQGVVA